MRYIFEKGPYKIYMSRDQEFSCDLEAIEHAEKIGADYVWKTDGTMNPDEVWRRREKNF
mgnify:CR=1 FL=1